MEKGALFFRITAAGTNEWAPIEHGGVHGASGACGRARGFSHPRREGAGRPSSAHAVRLFYRATGRKGSVASMMKTNQE
jgi:hypothetical protein